MVNDTTARSVAGLFWGRTEELPLYTRVGALVFVAVAIVAMSFCQLGFWPVGEVNDDPVYLILLLAPVAMGAIAFGPVTGVLLGLFGGLVAFAHAAILPLDFLEGYYFGTPLNTVGLFTFVALAAGVLFGLALRRDPQGGRRVALIIAVSVVVSFLASALSLVNMVMLVGGFDLFTLAHWYLAVSFETSALQALLDAVLIAVLCLAADRFVRAMKDRGSDRALYSVFRNFLVLVSAIVFMLVSAVIFSSTTIQEVEFAIEDMDEELSYLQDQLDLQPDINAELLIGGYDKDTEGAAFVMNEHGVILVSNDAAKFKVGTSLLAAIDEGDYLGDEAAVEALLEYYSSGRDPVLFIPDTDEDLTANMDLAFLGIRKLKDGYVGLHRTADTVFANRFGTMASTTVSALLLIVAIAALASVLVRRLIVRRIDEANRSLAKITAGNLGERVPEQSTREFASLADGINTTVGALSDMIDEVARRNEQDLATAKTIQESSLPTEFPAFPDIDKLDIYASMKTAKEVGGDFYDFFPIENTTRIGFVMADVSGKGIPAALFMMAARSQLRNFMEAGLPVNEAVDAANHQLCIGNDAGMFVTCWVGEIDYETGELAFVNGGHNPPVLLHGGAWSWMKEVSGMPLGLFDGIPYDLHKLQMAPGDVIYTYTDGVTEAMSATQELYGEERLQAVLDRSKDMNPRSIGVAVRRSLTDYTHDAEQSDDITMLILKYGVPPESEAVMVLPADGSQLVHVRNFINAELDRRKAPRHVYYEMDVFAETLFVNACRHAYPGATPDAPGFVRIGFEYLPSLSALKVTIADDGVPYDPLSEIDLVAPEGIGEAPGDDEGAPAGLDIVNGAVYERVDGSNVVSFTKSW
ncbi:MAG: SpoIIE family protein phosphatase [Eggerthellaceae bacterium]|nr:SpoIIE family protein phosphatase [Eggerthellaceae bacterium]